MNQRLDKPVRLRFVKVNQNYYKYWYDNALYQKESIPVKIDIQTIYIAFGVNFLQLVFIYFSVDHSLDHSSASSERQLDFECWSSFWRFRTWLTSFFFGS